MSCGVSFHLRNSWVIITIDAFRQLGAAQGAPGLPGGSFLRLQALPFHSEEARMSQAIVNPTDLRRFAQQLKHFNGELTTNLNALQRQMVSLSASWRDQEHQKFVEEFEQQMKMITRFVESNEQYVPFLLRKAERIEDYLNQR
jgi:uncharacterized protein YukE